MSEDKTCGTCLREPKDAGKPGCDTCTPDASNWLKGPDAPTFDPAELLGIEIPDTLAAAYSGLSISDVAMPLVRLLREHTLSWRNRVACADALTACLRSFYVLESEAKAHNAATSQRSQNP